MANLTSSQIKDSYQSVLTTSETTSDPTTGTFQNGKGTTITALGVSGTVTATKLVPTGNVTAGNGMYLPTTNVLAFSTDGSERMRIDASGNVGVATSTLTQRFVVNGGVLSRNDSFGGAGITFSNQENASGFVGVLAGSESNPNVIHRSDLSGHIFLASTTELMRINASGNVGIGATSPSAKLHVVGTLRVDGNENNGGGSGIWRSVKLSGGSGNTFNFNLAVDIFPNAVISGNFRYIKMTALYFMSGRATREEWIMCGTNSGVVSTPTLLGRASAGTAITGTPVLTSGASTLSIALTTSASLDASSFVFELIMT